MAERRKVRVYTYKLVEEGKISTPGRRVRDAPLSSRPRGARTTRE